MAIIYKVLGQINPTQDVLTTAYTVPALTQTIVSTVAVCNQSSSPVSFSIAVRPAGASIQNRHYINYNTPILPYDTVTLTLGLTLGNTDVISCSANSSSLSFNIFGSEIV